MMKNDVYLDISRKHKQTSTALAILSEQLTQKNWIVQQHNNFGLQHVLPKNTVVMKGCNQKLAEARVSSKDPTAVEPAHQQDWLNCGGWHGCYTIN